MKEKNIEKNEIRYIPTNDYVFKRIFGYKGNEDITADFLKAVTGVEYKDIYLEGTPILERDLIENKMGVLDVKIVADEINNIDIEMQITKSEYIADRILWYWAKMYSMSMEKGDTYDSTKRATCILIADFKLENLKNIPKFKTKWNVREEEYKDVILTNKLEIIIIELEKLEESINKIEENKKLLNWCQFIKAPEEVEDSIMNENENIKRAKEELDKINQDERERMLAELREKAIMDELAIRASGYKEGKEEGIIEGIEKGLVEGKKEGIQETEKKYIKKMLERKMTIEDIIEITGLTEEEIKSL